MLVAVFLANLVGAPEAFAQPNAPAASSSAAPAPKPAHKPHKPAPREPAPAPLPAPQLRVSLDSPSPDGPWLLREENTGTIPLEVMADARLLAFEVTPPPTPDAEAASPSSKHRARAAKDRPVRCALPASMRPGEVDRRPLVLPPGRAYVESIDPRLFCFGSRDSAALVPGAKLTPKLVGSRAMPVVVPDQEDPPSVASAEEWSGAETTIGTPAAHPAAELPAAPLSITAPQFVDLERGREIALAVTVTNHSKNPVRFLLRPETLAFDVTGPSGLGGSDPPPTARCAWPGPPPSPIPEAFTRLAPGGSAELTVILDAFCPEPMFDDPGLYFIRPRLDTRHTSGTSIGLATYDGEALAATVSRLRVRRSRQAAPSRARPELADAPPPTATRP
jgi:hypothetical protein